MPLSWQRLYTDGLNIEGPAPRPLERFKVALGDEGQIIVDAGVRFRGERGEWDKTGRIFKGIKLGFGGYTDYK